MRRSVAIAMTLILGTFAISSAAPDESPPAARPTVTNLLLAALAEDFTPDREVLVDLVVAPPNARLDLHWHPGEEFHYYMEGEVEVRIEGEPSIHGTPGTVGHVPFRKRHEAIAGPQGAKVLVFRVHTKGEPMRYVGDEHAPDGTGPR